MQSKFIPDSHRDSKVKSEDRKGAYDGNDTFPRR